VAKITTVKILLVIGTIKNCLLKQIDANNAFLHGDLHEEVYMEVPKRVVLPKSVQVCKLRKSLYGLRQASSQWYGKLSTVLIASGYTPITI